MDAVKLINRAYEKLTEDKLFTRWIINHESRISFNDFKDLLLNKIEKDNKTSEEILDEVAELMKLYKFEQ